MNLLDSSKSEEGLAAEAHGGRIWVEDANPGAVFCLSLPHAE